MNRIETIWFNGEWIYGRSDDGAAYRQSLLWYRRLMDASDTERARYEISTIGIHWPELDVDISFESFLYPEAEPSRIQRFFLTHEEINVSGFARKFGLNPSLLRSYVNGFKTPSKRKEEEIIRLIHRLGEEYAGVFRSDSC